MLAFKKLDILAIILWLVKPQIDKYKYIEFGIWVEICKKEEIHSWTGEEFWRKMEYYKKKYFDGIYNDLRIGGN